MRRVVAVPLVLILCLAVIMSGCGADPDSSDPTQAPERQTPTPGGTIAPTIDLSSALGENPDAEARASELLPITGRSDMKDCRTQVDPNELLSEEELFEALPCFVTLFPWPAGMQLDIAAYRAVAFVDDGEEWMFPPATLYQIAEGTNACAWYRTWLSAVDNGLTDQQEAAELMIVYVIPAYPETIPGFPAELDTADTRGFHAEIGKSVQLGDSSTLRQWLPGVCPFETWQIATPEAINDRRLGNVT